MCFIEGEIESCNLLVWAWRYIHCVCVCVCRVLWYNQLSRFTSCQVFIYYLVVFQSCTATVWGHCFGERKFGQTAWSAKVSIYSQPVSVDMVHICRALHSRVLMWWQQLRWVCSQLWFTQCVSKELCIQALLLWPQPRCHSKSWFTQCVSKELFTQDLLWPQPRCHSKSWFTQCVSKGLSHSYCYGHNPGVTASHDSHSVYLQGSTQVLFFFFLA